MPLTASSICPKLPCLDAPSLSSRSFCHFSTSNSLLVQSLSPHSCSLMCKASTESGFRWAKDATSPRMTSKHILPDDKKPMLSDVSRCCIPVIDMDSPTSVAIKSIATACEEYGFFQIVNHKVPQDLCESMLDAAVDLFHLPPEDKALLYSDDSVKNVRICHHYRTDQATKEKIPLWSEVFKHSWHPVDDFTDTLPVNPPQYREVIAPYAKHIGSLMTSLLSFMSQGLGLHADCLEHRIGENPTYRAQANYYPPCPNPELTLGLGVHTDRDVLTVILPTPEVQGLQVMKNEKWIVVDPIPGALIVNLGDQLQVLSNGRYRSVLHRAVTNKTQTRVSLAMFYGPSKDAVIGPIEHLIDERHPPKYRSYRFSEFLNEFRRQEGNRRRVKEVFELHG